MICVQTTAGLGAGVVGVNTEDDIVKAYRNGVIPTKAAATSSVGDVVTLSVWAGIIFDNVAAPSYEFPDHISYRIRFNGSTVPNTAAEGPSQIEIESAGNIDKGISYAESGFITLQRIVDGCILELRLQQRPLPSSVAMPPFVLKPLSTQYRAFPRPAATSDIFHQYSVGLGSLYLVCHRIK